MSTLPKQKIPYKEKTPEWRKSVVRALVESASFSGGDKSMLFTCRNAYEGKRGMGHLGYVTNPYNATDPHTRQFPARLRNYNIIKPIINAMHGEKSRRPFDYLVSVMNPDVHTRHDDAVAKAIMPVISQQFVNGINAAGIETGQESQPPQDPNAVAEGVKTSYKDERAIMGQQALSYLREYLDLPDQFQRGFLNILVDGEVYSYKTAKRDDAEYQIVPPEDVWFPKSTGVRYVEDADKVVRRIRMTINQIVDQFYDLLKPEEIDALENGSSLGVEGLYTPSVGGDGRATAKLGEINVHHVTWKSFTQLWILHFTDETGAPQEMMVDETYIADKDAGETLEKFWINEWWEGWEIDNRFWLGIEPCNVQRRSMSNLSTCKGPYNGYRIAASLVTDMLAYQDLYDIFHFRMELSIAKNKDKIALMDINMIPKKPGWDADKFMYYADAMGYAWVDPTAEGSDGKPSSFAQFQVLDMSLGQYIQAQNALLMAIKQECQESVGFNPQRLGDVMASAGNGATERAVFQSNAITEELFRQYEKFQEKECQGLLDLSKHMWREGKKSSYLSSDYRIQMLNIDGEDYGEADLGVFCKSGAKEAEKTAAIKQLSQAYIQNGGDILTAVQILDNENFSQIKKLVADAESARKAYEQQTAQQQQAMQSEQIAAQQDAAENAALDRLDEQTRQFAHERELKLMDLDAKMAGLADSDGDGEPDWAERQDASIKREKMQSEERMELRRMALEREKLAVAREKIASDAKAKRAAKK